MTADPPLNVTHRVGHSLPEKLWRRWKLIAWVLPPVLVLVRFPGGGWETLGMLFALPLWWPAVSLLSLLPRLILRKRGFDVLPAAVGIPMVGVLWGFVIFMLGMPGEGDSGSSPSPLGGLLPFLGQRSEQITFMLALLVVVSSWIVAVVTASIAKPGGTETRHGKRIIIGAVSVVVGFILAVLSITVVTMIGPKDAAGDRELTAALMGKHQAMERQEAHWDELQQDLQPVREIVADDGWIVDGWSGARSDRGGTYWMVANWTRFMEGSVPEVAHKTRTQLETEGWALHEPDAVKWGDAPAEVTLEDAEGHIRYVSYLLRDAAGLEVSVTVETPQSNAVVVADEVPPGNVLVTVSTHSDWYWLERGESRKILATDWVTDDSAEKVVQLGSPKPTLFAANEWPDLAQIQK